jgi:glycosyltransferase involved in cell wall biosynthesis
MPVEATGLVLTFNGEKWLDRTLSSLGFCSHLLVVDSGSSDTTLDIAGRHGAEILQRDWEGTIPQFRFAFERVKTRWVVTLDQDEWLSEELKPNLAAALSEPGENVGFWCSRLSYYYDRYIRHGGWYPDLLLRAFRLDGMELAGTLPHEEFRPLGPARRLSGDIIHHPYADLDEHVAKINSYTSVAARELAARGKRSGAAKAVARGVWKFLRVYLLKRGFMDGRAGFVLAVHSFLYAFLKYLKLAEMDVRQGPPDRESGAS